MFINYLAVSEVPRVAQAETENPLIWTDADGGWEYGPGLNARMPNDAIGCLCGSLRWEKRQGAQPSSTRLVDQGRYSLHITISRQRRVLCSPTNRPSGIFAMTSPDPLQQLRRLDRSSSKFCDQLNNVLHGEEYNRRLKNIQDNDLAGLVDYLEEVRRHVGLLRSPLRSA